MKTNIRPALGLTAIVAVTLIIFQVSCSTGTPEEKTEAAPEKKELTNEEIRSRGQYVATVSGCHDCHTPKKFGPQGPFFDSTRMLSGHHASDPLPPIDEDLKALYTFLRTVPAISNRVPGPVPPNEVAKMAK